MLIICLMGPTATGKTQLAIELSKIIPCDIISVDSAMVYRDMDIGTAKPSNELLAQVPHRLINIRDPAQPYSVGEFVRESTIEIENILKSGRIPLLVGGTMLYFYALQQGLSTLPTSSPEIRKQFKVSNQENLKSAYNTLVKYDPETAKRLHPNDIQRIHRALEVLSLTGKPLSQLQQETDKTLASYKILNLAIFPSDRAQLRETIRLRFDNMIEAGFIEEVAKLKQRTDLSKDLPALRTIGYRQIWDYLSGDIDKATMHTQSVIATGQLAKRQLTWLRRWKDLHAFNQQDPQLTRSATQLINQHLS